MKNNKDLLNNLIEDYLKEKDSADEKHLINLFSESSCNNLDWDEQQMGNKTEIASDIWKKVMQSRRKTKRHKQIRWTISIAASLILVIGLNFWLQKLNHAEQLISIATSERMDSLLMPDGSVIFLSPDTKIQYNNNFNHKTREIELVKGNAFFKVARNPQKPFIINSGAIKTKVLGTSFNIHMGADGYRVTVHTGKVNVSSDNEAVNLVAFQEATYSALDGHLSINAVSRDFVSPWYNRDITLTNQSLKTILNLVEQKYGLKAIRVNPEQLDFRATVFIACDATLESIIQQINYITNLKLEAHDKEISCRK